MKITRVGVDLAKNDLCICMGAWITEDRLGYGTDRNKPRSFGARDIVTLRIAAGEGVPVR